MITEHCTHPPLVLLIDTPVTSAQISMIAEQLAAVAESGRTPALSDGARLEVIECSWCRNPDASQSGTVPT